MNGVSRPSLLKESIDSIMHMPTMQHLIKHYNADRSFLVVANETRNVNKQ